MNPFLLRFWPYLIGLLLLGGLGWYLHHAGYKSGQAERESYYGPILRAAQSLAQAEQARLQRQETDSKVALMAQEKTHAENEINLKARADAAEHRYARILQDSARRTACGVPAAAGASSEPSDAAAVAERFGRVATRLRGVGERAVADGQRYAECQSFYNAQRDISGR